eukprot:9580134-Lingulodinium_polyedra.AAC.1
MATARQNRVLGMATAWQQQNVAMARHWHGNGKHGRGNGITEAWRTLGNGMAVAQPCTALARQRRGANVAAAWQWHGNGAPM